LTTKIYETCLKYNSTFCENGWRHEDIINPHVPVNEKPRLILGEKLDQICKALCPVKLRYDGKPIHL
jgi:hypothetical protein